MRLWSRVVSLSRNLFHKDSCSLTRRSIRGLSVNEARRAALMELGGEDHVKESVRDVNNDRVRSVTEWHLELVAGMC